jgi:hypothetical protein
MSVAANNPPKPLRRQVVSKLEFRFAKSEKGKALIAEFLAGGEVFTQADLAMLKKLEYTFKNSEKGRNLIKEIQSLVK